MGHVLSKALAFAAIIFLAFVLKKAGLFGPTDYRIMAKVVLNVTLPAAVIVSFATNTLDLSMLLVSLLGFVCNVAMLLARICPTLGESATPSRSIPPALRATSLCAREALTDRGGEVEPPYDNGGKASLLFQIVL